MEIWKQSKALIAVQVDDEVNHKPWFRECTYREKSSSYVVGISMKSGSVLNRCRGRIDDHVDRSSLEDPNMTNNSIRVMESVEKLNM